MPWGESHWATTDRTGRADIRRSRLWVAEFAPLVPQWVASLKSGYARTLDTATLPTCDEDKRPASVKAAGYKTAVITFRRVPAMRRSRRDAQGYQWLPHSRSSTV